jgi:hypothetical protein
MRKLPADSSLEKLDGAVWDSTVRIPPHQSVGIIFSVPYRLSEYSTSAAELGLEDKLSEFLGRRLRDINGMTFFDYAAKYRIEMPDIRDALPKDHKVEQKQPAKKATPLIPPDRGDMLDKIHACQNADQLLDRCKRDNVSPDSSPWIKYGGWPTKLRELPTPPAGYTLDPSPDLCAIVGEWRNYCKAKVK